MNSYLVKTTFANGDMVQRYVSAVSASQAIAYVAIDAVNSGLDVASIALAFKN